MFLTNIFGRRRKQEAAMVALIHAYTRPERSIAEQFQDIIRLADKP